MAIRERDIDPTAKRRVRRRALAAEPGMRALIENAKIELIPMTSLERAIGELPANAMISMTCSPAKSIGATLDETERLLADGHHVVPHVSARMVRDHEHLVAIRTRLQHLGCREFFLVGGDADPPGIFFDAIEFLDAFLALDDADGPKHRAVDHIGYTSYPDTHPLITNEQLHVALHRKQEQILATGRTAHVSTQMCFDADQIRTWLRRERAAGLTVPVHLGVSGVIDKTKLMTMGVRLGVGTSLRYLSKNKRALGKLLTQRSYRPDQLLRPLAKDLDELGIEAIHLYTFNQVAATEAWRTATLAR
ncbi:MAG: methylenetetrahydrofolate reductase [Actinomycetota bacterium]